MSQFMVVGGDRPRPHFMCRRTHSAASRPSRLLIFGLLPLVLFSFFVVLFFFVEIVIISFLFFFLFLFLFLFSFFLLVVFRVVSDYSPRTSFLSHREHLQVFLRLGVEYLPRPSIVPGTRLAQMSPSEGLLKGIGQRIACSEGQILYIFEDHFASPMKVHLIDQRRTC